MTVLVGSHVERRDPLAAAARRDAEVIQIHLSAPLNWRVPVVRGDEAALAAAGLPIYVHAPYLLNPASIRPEQRRRSRAALAVQLQAAAGIGAAGLVVHGGHPTGGGSVAEGIAGWLEVLDGLEQPCRLLIENTAGGTRAVAREPGALQRLFAALRDHGHDVGFVLDTCHAHAAGVPLEGLVAALRDAVGAIDLVHANDSKDAAGSGRDRHEHLGHGHIPTGMLIELIAGAGAPVVVETPGGAAEQAADIAWIRDRLR